MPLTPLTATVHILKVPRVSVSRCLLDLATWRFMRAAFLATRFRGSALCHLNSKVYSGSRISISSFDELGTVLSSSVNI